MTKEDRLISFFIPSLSGGGGEKFTINLMQGFIDRGLNVELVVMDYSGPLVPYIPKGCSVVNLNTKKRFFPSLPRLLKYLITQKPYTIISGLNHSNVVSIIAKCILFSNKTRLVVVVHTNPYQAIRHSNTFKSKLMPVFMFLTYWSADYVVGVSKGAAEDILGTVPYLKDKIKVIYNPIITHDLFTKAKEPVDHPWFAPNSPPVILGAGRLTKAKNFPTLLKAFALVRKEIDSRLVILGEGEEGKNLEKIAKELGIEEYLWMPGFVDNPYKYMSKASVLVLSSIYEGLPTVLIEALALGCQVVSTDCKSGPREILDNGKFGKLVPVGDYKEMAYAIEEILTYNIHYDIDKSALEKYMLRYSSEEYMKLIFSEGGQYEA